MKTKINNDIWVHDCVKVSTDMDNNEEKTAWWITLKVGNNIAIHLFPAASTYEGTRNLAIQLAGSLDESLDKLFNAHFEKK